MEDAALEALELSSNRLDVRHIRALCQGTGWARLRHLDLSHNMLGVEGVTALAHASGFEQLESLNVSYNDVRLQGVSALVLQSRQDSGRSRCRGIESRTRRRSCWRGASL